MEPSIPDPIVAPVIAPKNSCASCLLLVILAIWGILAPIAAYQYGHMEGMKAGILKRYDSVTGKIDSGYQDLKAGARRTTDNAREKLRSTRDGLQTRWNASKSDIVDTVSSSSMLSSWITKDKPTSVTDLQSTASESLGWFKKKKSLPAADVYTTPSKRWGWFSRDANTSSTGSQ